jgi:hypothetical protein
MLALSSRHVSSRYDDQSVNYHDGDIVIITIQLRRIARLAFCVVDVACQRRSVVYHWRIREKQSGGRARLRRLCVVDAVLVHQSVGVRGVQETASRGANVASRTRRNRGGVGGTKRPNCRPNDFGKTTTGLPCHASLP